MRTIYDSKHLRVIIPSTRAEVLALILAAAAIASVIKGDINTAWHLLEIGLLTAIAEKV